MSSKKIPQEIRPPSIKTLCRYGLSMADWLAMAGLFGICHVCKRRPSSGRLVVDHEHVKGFKKLPPEQRKTYVRGLTCWNCNYRFLAKGMSLAVAQNLVNYFLRYHGVTVSKNSPYADKTVPG